MSLAQIITHLFTVAPTLLPVLADAAAKSVAILAVTAIATIAMRRASAAARHLVWLLGLASLLGLPILSAALPAWHVLPAWAMPTPAQSASPPTMPPVAMETPIPQPIVAQSPAPLDEPPNNTTPQPPVIASPAPASPNALPPAPAATPGIHTSWQAWTFLAWAVGGSLLLAHILLGMTSLAWLGRRSDRITEADWITLLGDLSAQLGLRRDVTLLASGHRTMPMVWGILRIRLLLPADATDWTGEQRRAVLLHELAHAKRHDCLWQLLAHFIRAVYWFNPLAWLACRRLQTEREMACDDLVLSRGTKPSTYAEQLLAVAADMPAPRLTTAAIAMARPSALEGRLLAILDARRNRKTVAAVTVVATLLAALAITAAVAMIRGQAPKPISASITLLADRAGDPLSNKSPPIEIAKPAEVAALSAYFPQLGKTSDTAAGWPAGAQIIFKYPDGRKATVVVSSSDDFGLWTEGRGDWNVHGDLAAFLDRLRPQPIEPAASAKLRRAPHLQFGPATDRTLTSVDEKTLEGPGIEFLDLGSGQIVQLPTSLQVPDNAVPDGGNPQFQAADNWLTSNGALVYFQGQDSNNANQLMDFGDKIRFVEADANTWDTLSPDDFEERWTKGNAVQQELYFGDWPDLPETYLFRLRDGKRGMLQIVKLIGNSEAVELRFRQIEEPGTATTAPVEPRPPQASDRAALEKRRDAADAAKLQQIQAQANYDAALKCNGDAQELRKLAGPSVIAQLDPQGQTLRGQMGDVELQIDLLTKKGYLANAPLMVQDKALLEELHDQMDRSDKRFADAYVRSLLLKKQRADELIQIYTNALKTGVMPPSPPSPPATEPATQPAAAPVTPAASDPSARVTITSGHDEYLLGENIMVTYRVQNAGKDPIPYEPGGFYPEFRLNDGYRAAAVLVDDRGHPLPGKVETTPWPDNMGGRVSRWELKPGESHRQTLYLGRYLRLVQPGRYRIVISNVDRLDPAKVYSAGQITLRLKEPTADEARQIYLRMKSLPSGPVTEIGQVRENAVSDFKGLLNPVYLPILAEYAGKGDADALTALGQMRTPESVASTVDLIKQFMHDGKADMAMSALMQMEKSLPDPRYFDTNYGDPDKSQRQYMQQTWKSDYAPTIRALSAYWARAKGSKYLAEISFIYDCIGTPDDLPDLMLAYTKSIEATKTLPFETNQYFRPRGSAYGFFFSTDQLLARGAKPPVNPETPGEAAVYFDALQQDKNFRPKDWVDQAVRWLGYPTPYLRELVLDHLPQPVPQPVLDLLPKMLGDGYVDLQIAACRIAAANPRAAFREPILKILEKAREEHLLDNAELAAEPNEISKDEVMEILAGRIVGDLGGNAVVRLLALAGMGDDSLLGYTTNLPLPDEQSAKAAWMRFIDLNRTRLRTGPPFNLGDPAMTRDLFPAGFVFEVNGQRWSPDSAVSATRPATQPDAPATRPVAGAKSDAPVDIAKLPNADLDRIAHGVSATLNAARRVAEFDGNHIPRECWAPAIAALRPLEVEERQGNVRIVLWRRDGASSGLLAMLMTSSTIPESGKNETVMPLVKGNDGFLQAVPAESPDKSRTIAVSSLYVFKSSTPTTAPATQPADATLTVHLLDASGQPLRHEEVGMQLTSIGYSAMINHPSYWPDAQGTVKIPGLAPGHYRFMMDGWDPEFLDVDVPTGGLTTQVRIIRPKDRHLDLFFPKVEVVHNDQTHGRYLLHVKIGNSSEQPYTLTDDDLALWTGQHVIRLPKDGSYAGDVIPARGKGNLELWLKWSTYEKQGIWWKYNGAIDIKGPMGSAGPGLEHYRVIAGNSLSLPIVLPAPSGAPASPRYHGPGPAAAPAPSANAP